MAADWYGLMRVGNGDVVWFFDAATVEKHNSVVRIWIKTLQISGPGAFDNWETVVRSDFDCARRTQHVLQMIAYNKEGNAVSSRSDYKEPLLTVPGSAGEALLETICEKDFPKNPNRQNYFKIPGNDPVAAIRRHLEKTK